LARSGAGGPEDIQRAVENAKGLGRFIRSLVGLDRQVVNAKFADFLDGTTATANQIDFIGVVVSYLTRYGAMEPAQLYDPPFTDNAPKGPDEFFPPTQMARLIAIIRSINASLMSRPRSAARGWHLSLNQCVRQAPVQGRSTDPEILRNVLAGVTVRLHPLRGGDVVGVGDRPVL
jgi:hypothetical protein